MSTEEKSLPVSESKSSVNFIEAIINEDLKQGKNNGRVHTRFPPEPNGYLHIGHAKSILLNYGIARKYNGKFNLRFDDTNPTKEEQEYVDSILADVRWLGAEWEDRLFFASDYFDQLYHWAEKLIQEGKAYVDDQPADLISEQRGVPTKPGIESPFRNRTPEENLDLFRRMRAGEFQNGEKVLRAKIDMASPNMHMRDPVMYRILHAHHHRTGNKWCIYPMYDWAHGESDYLEGITHSICTLEFEVHRPLYDWFVDQIKEADYRPRQIEFARLNLTYTVMSKRKLLELVKEGYVNGWDDPRMPTISGLRRRGYTPESLRMFAEKVGVAKRDNVIDVALLEYSVREDLNKKAKRMMAVLNPVKLIITNYPEHQVEELPTENNPEDPDAGLRNIPFTREIYIERDDFMIDPPKKYFRLTPGNEVRLKSAYIIRCESYKTDDKGEITEIYCTYDPESKSGAVGSNRKVKGTLHWVSAIHAVDAEIRLFDRLFRVENPEDVAEGEDYKINLNPDSLKILTHCKLEPELTNAVPGEKFQFQRLGYFTVDPETTPGNLVFNRTVPLKDSWTKSNQ
ncbi:MAG TPA: glutamine--tRNA ligase/YqeY domain fusion protein [Bacteroidales bacterium]|nr:glutamine--tRNA ligase/YqeY domain fusion protein [Bacteroidales bacterium]HPR59056.1 glutamine--tRNA ligase/YqeY domain fusion protein [Bacteroidales bacterium]